MQLLFQSFLVLTVAVYWASAQNEASKPLPSFDAENVHADERFIKTASLTFATSTVTVTTIAVTTCTTSTGGLSVCTASGRRRRGLNLSGNKEGRGLFYNENEEAAEEGNMFLPLPKTPEEKPALPPVVSARQVSEPIPFVVQSGFNAPAGQGRVLLYFGTSTVTTTTTTTTTTSLTAACRSTTGYQLCGSIGK